MNRWLTDLAEQGFRVAEARIAEEEAKGSAGLIRVLIRRLWEWRLYPYGEKP